MSLRVVLYAEGTRETSRELTMAPTPGARLPDANLGPGHVLIARCLEWILGKPRAEIHFEGPLRTRGRVAKGLMLHDARVLRQLLTWANPTHRPDLAVVLVDADDQKS